MRYPAAVIALVALQVAPAPAAAQRPVDAGAAVHPEAYIKVWNGGGSVRVEGWSADSVGVEGRVRGGPDAFFLHSDERAVKLGLQGAPAAAYGELVVRVPATATVWIRTGSAGVTVRGLVGAVDVHSVSGAIDIAGRPSNAYAESMGGDVALDLEAGIARVRTASGGISFTGSAADLTISTIDGALDVEADDLLRGRFTTVQGDVRFTGGVRSGGALTFETHSGDVELVLAASLEAAFDLSTFRGRIDPELRGLPAPTRGTARTTLTFETGAGLAEVTARSYSGSIRVRER